MQRRNKKLLKKAAEQAANEFVDDVALKLTTLVQHASSLFTSMNSAPTQPDAIGDQFQQAVFGPKIPTLKLTKLNLNLYNHAFDGDITQVIQDLAKGANVDYDYGSLERDTPLLTAAAHGHTDIVRILLKRNALVDKANDNACTPLWAAIKQGHDDTVALLLEHGANPNNKAPGCLYTPLHIACILNRLEIIVLLIAKGVDVNAASDNGETPLHFAAQHGHTVVVRLLLLNGAATAPRQTDAAGATPLLLAIEHNRAACVEALLQNGASTLDLDTEDHLSALHAAAKFNRVKIAVLILQKDRQLNRQLSSNHATPLHLAARLNHKEFVRFLLQQGADPSMTLSDGATTPFLCATTMGNMESAAVFLEFGIDVNARQTSDGSTALHIAIASDNMKAFTWLLDHGADVSIENSIPGVTPLFTAVAEEQAEMTDRILQKITENGTATKILANFLQTLANHHTAEDMVKFIKTLQRNQFSHQMILDLLPSRLTREESLTEKTPLTKLIRKIKRATQLSRPRYSHRLFSDTQVLPPPAAPLTPDTVESIRQKLLTFAFDPTHGVGRGLVMHGDKKDYGLISEDQDENTRVCKK